MSNSDDEIQEIEAKRQKSKALQLEIQNIWILNQIKYISVSQEDSEVEIEILDEPEQGKLKNSSSKPEKSIN